MSSGSSNGGGGADPWAWLGLLKWTLNQQRGDDDNNNDSKNGGGGDNDDGDDRQHQPGFSDAREPPVPMSKEDKAFLERVLAEGIVNEGDRMSEILQDFATAMDQYKSKSFATATTKTTTAQASTAAEGTTMENDDKEEGGQELHGVMVDEDRIVDGLLELRDICEHIDYARGFVHMKGLDYLLGAVQLPSPPVIPPSIRNTCLMVMSTLAQNNPPVQKQLVELGAVKIFSDLFISEIDHGDNNSNNSNSKDRSTFLTKLMQTISATVRGYDLTEQIFEKLPQSASLMELGLTWPGVGVSPSTKDQQQLQQHRDGDTSIGEQLHTKTLFLLRAILTSDTATNERAMAFGDSIRAIIVGSLSSSSRQKYLNDPSSSTMIRQTSVDLLRQLLERQFATPVLRDYKQSLASFGIRRVTTLRSIVSRRADGVDTDDGCTGAEEELHDWEIILKAVAQL